MKRDHLKWAIPYSIFVPVEFYGTIVMNIKIKTFTALSLIFVMALYLSILTPQMAPFTKGTSSIFWNYATNVDIGSKTNYIGYACLPIDDMFFYYESGHCNSYFYYVPREDVEKDFSKVLDKIQNFKESKIPIERMVYTAWKKITGKITVDNFLREIHNEQRKHLKYFENTNPFLGMRWERFQGYWKNIIFEFLFFLVLIIFLCYSWFKKFNALRWAIHFGLFFPLLYIPYLLAYCPLVFTSSGGGGILYPKVLWHLKGLYIFDRIFTFQSTYILKMEIYIIDKFPKLLQPISQMIMLPNEKLSEYFLIGLINALVTGIFYGFIMYHVLKKRQKITLFFRECFLPEKNEIK